MPKLFAQSKTVIRMQEAEDKAQVLRQQLNS
jgi:hypothetical protein